MTLSKDSQQVAYQQNHQHGAEAYASATAITPAVIAKISSSESENQNQNNDEYQHLASSGLNAGGGEVWFEISPRLARAPNPTSIERAGLRKLFRNAQLTQIGEKSRKAQSKARNETAISGLARR
jgi:hypothetical protein